MKTSKRIISLLLAVVLTMTIIPFSGIVASAETFSGSCGDNLTWTLDDVTGVLKISGTGEMTNFSGGGSPWMSKRNYIIHVEVNDNVTTIGNNAFFNLPELKTVSVGKSVKKIGDQAFYMCPALERIDIAPENQSFYSDANGVLYDKAQTTIILCPINAQVECFVIPNTVKNITMKAFMSNANIVEIIAEESPEEVKLSIQQEAFAYMSKLENVTINRVLNLIGYKAFAGCSNLNEITFLSIKCSIGKDAFANCNNLSNVNYCGTEEEWNRISKSEGNEVFTNTTINYLYGHTCEFSNRIVTKNPTCTESGIETCSCYCGNTETREISPLGHTAGEWKTTADATCTATGSRVKYCTTCGAVVEEEAIPTTAHIDENGDNFCDNCNNNLADNSDDNNNDDIVDSEKDCDHICHKSGISGFFWKIARFFNKLFRINKYCECGAAHY